MSSEARRRFCVLSCAVTHNFWVNVLNLLKIVENFLILNYNSIVESFNTLIRKYLNLRSNDMSEVQKFIKKYAETNKKFYITEVIDRIKNLRYSKTA